MSTPSDLRGKTFGRLTAIEPTDERRNRYIVWRCECACGNECFVSSHKLRGGTTTSCGCARRGRRDRKPIGGYVVVKERVCRQCGARFEGGPRAWYCPDCRAERKKEAARRCREKGKADRPLGSTDYCERCGKPYTVKAARQRYCPDCAYEAVREADRPASIAWNREHKDSYYPAKNAKRRAQAQKDREEKQRAEV